MALTKVTYSMIDSSVVNLTDFGPAANGTTDDGQKILDAIAATPINGTLIIPEGSYGVSALEITRNNITIVLEGTLVNITPLNPPPQFHTGAPSYGAPPDEVSNYPTLYLNGCENLTITGSGKISTPWYEGIKAVNCDFLTLTNFKIEGVRETNLSSFLRGAWDGIWIDSAENLLIDNLEIFNIGGIRQAVLDQRWSGNPNGVSGNGITINNGNSVTIKNCYLHDLAWQTIYPMDTQKCRILNNVCENATGFCQYNSLGDYSVTPLDYIIDGNIIRNMSGNGLDLSVGSTGITIAAGRVTNNTFKYIGFLPNMLGQFDGAYISVNHPPSNYMTDIVIDGNIMEEECASMGIYLDHIQNIIISNNIVRKTTNIGVQLNTCANVVITGNDFQEIPGSFVGMINGSNPYVVITGNICNMGGFPVVLTGGATANQLIVADNRFLNIAPTTILIEFNDATFDGNYFGPGTTTQIGGNNLRIERNVFEESVQMTLNKSVISTNYCYKTVSLPDTINTTFNNNIVNGSEGNHLLSIDVGGLSRQPTKLSVIGNVIYGNTGGDAVFGSATNSVFANVLVTGSYNISGAGTTILY